MLLPVLVATTYSPDSLLIVALALLFVPTYLAALRRRARLGRFAIVNGLVGWTGIGWIVMLVVAAWPDPSTRPAREAGLPPTGR